MTQNINFAKMNLVELKELRKRIDKAMVNAERAARKTALEDVQKVAQKHGFSLLELVDGRSISGVSKRKAAPKYQNPKNTSETWSGRGRQPEWFKKAVESGVPREKMEV